MGKKLKIAIIGTGFWAKYQIHAWHALPGVALEVVAVCDTRGTSAADTAEAHGIKNWYTNPSDLFEHEALDVVDIISSNSSHPDLVFQAANAGIHVICQKPMADEFGTCKEMVNHCWKSGVKFFIHENFRWQSPIRKCKGIMELGNIGNVFKAKITFCSAFPVFKNQPSLARLKRFIISDLGVHLLDTCRFLFGDVEQVYCQTLKINPHINGEDVANILLTMKNGIHCFIEMSYASHLETETFPQTLLLIEGDKGSLRLDHDYNITVTREGKDSCKIKATPKQYDWADPFYALVHSSIVPCNQNFLDDLLGNGNAETTGEDNLKTMELVFLSYESALKNQVMKTSL